jgi:hypothetical protein
MVCGLFKCLNCGELGHRKIILNAASTAHEKGNIAF